MQRPQPRLALFPEDLSEDLTVARCSALLISVCADLKLSAETKYDALALLVGARLARCGGRHFQRTKRRASLSAAGVAFSARAKRPARFRALPS